MTTYIHVMSLFRSIASARKFTAPAARSIYTLPDLKYGYGELEPIISGEIMEIHHSKHHNT